MKIGVKVKKYLGIDVGGTNIKYALVDENYQVSKAKSIETPLQKEGFLQGLINIINEHHDICGIGISLPGLINSRTGDIVVIGAIKGLNGFALVKELQAMGVAKPIHIENDAKCATISEIVCGNAVGLEDFVCITVGTGVGGGVVVDGKLVKGQNFAAGELGMLRFDINTDATMSDQSGLKCTRERYALKHDMEAVNVDGELALSDPEICKMFYKYLNRLIHNVVYVLNPQKILLGGAISKDDKFISKLQAGSEVSEIEEYVEHIIDRCKNGNDAGLIGAVHELRINNQI